MPAIAYFANTAKADLFEVEVRGEVRWGPPLPRLPSPAKGKRIFLR